LARHATHPRHQ
jgi:hypothetical protein